MTSSVHFASILVNRATIIYVKASILLKHFTSIVVQRNGMHSLANRLSIYMHNQGDIKYVHLDYIRTSCVRLNNKALNRNILQI